jgi:hypothetical protein
MAAPASPNARDLEFGSTAGLTTWNPGSLAGFSATASNSRLLLTTTPQASGTTILSGVYRDCPTGTDWCAWTRIKVRGGTGFTAVAPYGGGLFLATADIDANPSTADVITANFYTRNNATSSLFYIQTWTAYNAASGTLVAIDMGEMPSDIWVRVRWGNSATRLSIDVASDGDGWKQVYSTTSPFLTPARIGLNSIAGQSAADPTPVVISDFLRFGTSADLNADTLGNLI